MKLCQTSLFCCFLLSALLFTGCKDKKSVQVYRVAKGESAETPQPPEQAMAAGAVPPMGGMGGMPAAGAALPPEAAAKQAAQVADVAPAGWEKQPLSSIRQASYLVKGADGATADISIIILGGAAGGPLDNVNRWLSQLGQPPIDDAKLAQMAQHAASPIGDVTLVDLQGVPEGGDKAKDGRIIAGMVPGERTVFFKMRGNPEIVGKQKEAFVQWIGTVKLAGGVPAAMPAAPSGSKLPPGHPSTTTEAKASPLKWVAPTSWKSIPASSMRIASFEVAGDAEAKADASVSTFPGDCGGDLENVNRWRGQLGLDPLEADGLKPLVAQVKCKDGEIQTVELAGAENSTLAGWTRVDGNSWFFKLTGPTQLVQAEKGRFTKFLESVQLHP